MRTQDIHALLKQRFDAKVILVSPETGGRSSADVKVYGYKCTVVDYDPSLKLKTYLNSDRLVGGVLVGELDLRALGIKPELMCGECEFIEVQEGCCYVLSQEWFAEKFNMPHIQFFRKYVEPHGSSRHKYYLEHQVWFSPAYASMDNMNPFYHPNNNSGETIETFLKRLQKYVTLVALQHVETQR